MVAKKTEVDGGKENTGSTTEGLGRSPGAVEPDRSAKGKQCSSNTT